MKAEIQNSETPSQALLFTSEQIGIRVAELGELLTREYQGKEPVFVAVLHGAVIFFADLIRAVHLDILVDMVCISSYGNDTKPSTRPQLALPPRLDWSGRDVVFVEGIVDTGSTASLLLDLAREGGARTARLCVLLDKPARRTERISPDYVGFTIPDLFVVGYGMDFQGRGRNLSGIVVLES